VPQAPFGGRPGYLVAYSPGDGGGAAWPVLRQGFFARPGSASHADAPRRGGRGLRAGLAWRVAGSAAALIAAKPWLGVAAYLTA